MASDLSGAPEWVVKGCTAFTDGKSDRICSVASVEGSNKLSQCRSNAQNQGRADIARQFEVLVRAMFSNYQATDATAPEDKKAIDAAIRATQQKISDLRVEENWFSLDGRCFVLMVLDLAGFESSVSKINQGRDARNQVNKNADKAFDELDRRTAE
jgi:hypothetical protein